MTPLVVLIGIVMGSAVTLSMGLGMVLVVLIVASHNQADMGRDLVPLFGSFLLFVGLASISALAFLWELKKHRLRVLAQVLMWATVGLIAWHYWPN